MLSSRELTTMLQEYSTTPVLSVYVDADQHDPAARDVWRVHLRHGLDAERDRLAGASHDEREAFGAARETIEAAIERDASAFLPGRAWVGFATATDLIRGERVEAPMPNLVRWGPGLRIAPYVRAFKQAHPVLTVVLDRRQAALYRYRFHQLERLEQLHADTFLGDLSEIEISKRATQHSGVRGKTGTDAARSLLDNAAHKLVMRIIDELADAEDDGALVIGGTGEQIAALRTALPHELAGQVIEAPSLHHGLTPAELGSYLETAVLEFSDRRLGQLCDEIVEQARAGGNGCLGREQTARALQEQRVRTLLVSDGLQQDDPDLTDQLVVAALVDNGATVHLAAREVGERLDREGEGCGALLHYRPGAAGPEPG